MNKTNSLWKMSINIRTMGSYKLPVFCTIDSARLVSIMFTIAAFSGCGYNIEKSKDFFIKFLKFTVLHFYIFLFQFFNIFIAYSLEITGRQATFFTLIFYFIEEIGRCLRILFVLIKRNTMCISEAECGERPHVSRFCWCESPPSAQASVQARSVWYRDLDKSCWLPLPLD